MREVVKKEVLKLLHVLIIYPVPYVNGLAPFRSSPRREG
jgi:hypothetical protein